MTSGGCSWPPSTSTPASARPVAPVGTRKKAAASTGGGLSNRRCSCVGATDRPGLVRRLDAGWLLGLAHWRLPRLQLGRFGRCQLERRLTLRLGLQLRLELGLGLGLGLGL